jgi:hypothetical protein
MSAGGDSGSIIVDKEFQPVALLWGGDDYEFAHGPKNVTYGSPLSKVIEDIEKCMRWTKGSVSIVCLSDRFAWIFRLQKSLPKL